MTERIDLRRIEDAAPNDVSTDDLRAMVDAIRAAHDLIEWMHGRGRSYAGDVIHERLRVALAPFDFGSATND